MNETFELFGLTIHWYGVILTFAMIMALLLFAYLCSKNKIEIDFVLTMFIFAIVFAIFGARLFYVVPRAEYWQSWEGVALAFNITQGGLTIVGGIPCGALGIYIVCKMYGKSTFRVFDLVIPALLLGQVIGRWGNFINQEVYGIPITQEWLQFFPIAVMIDGVPRCASFFYEMALNFVALITILIVMKKFKGRLKCGFVSLCYVIWYGFVRGMLEFVKADALSIGNFKIIQFISFCCCLVGIVLLILLQVGKIKVENEKMYMRHFNYAFIPPQTADEPNVSEKVYYGNRKYNENIIDKRRLK